MRALKRPGSQHRGMVPGLNGMLLAWGSGLHRT